MPRSTTTPFRGRSRAFAAGLVLTLGLAHAVSAQAGEEALFARQRQPVPTMALRAEFRALTTSRLSTDLFAPTEDELGQANLVLRGALPLGERLVLDAQMPLTAKIGMIPVPPLPDLYEFAWQAGPGDLAVTASWLARTQEELPVNVTLQARGVLPTGESRYDDPSQEYLPLGNGFRNLGVAVGINRAIRRSNQRNDFYLAYANAGYVHRSSRTFGAPDGFGAERRLTPGAVTTMSVGVAFQRLTPVRKRFLTWESWSVGVELERLNVGAVLPLEPRHEVTRLGLKAVTGAASGGAFVQFLGIEWLDGRKYFTSSLDIPVGFDIGRLSF